MHDAALGGRAPHGNRDSPATIQRRTVSSLVGSQMLGGIGVASGIAVGSLLAEQIVGTADLAGLANTTQVLGAALITVPMARLMAARGRRVGLVAGYACGTVGAALAIWAGVVSSFALLLVGTALFGAATTSNSQARYAATDLAEPRHRGRALSVVVWATTVGAVLGPNLLGPAGRLGQLVGIPALVGPFLISLAGFVLAGLLLSLRMRPDPLLTAQRLSRTAGEEGHPHGSLRRALRVMRSSRGALLGVAAVATGHTVMVGVMVMTPLQMHHGGAALRLVGFVISVHILGMYALSPVTGWLVDRLGARPVILAGAAVFVVAMTVAGRAPEGWSAGLMIGLFLLGVGWSCTLVAGSTLLSNSVPLAERPGVQGASDVVMGLSAAAGGALAGVVVGSWGFGWLCAIAGLLALALGAATGLSHVGRGSRRSLLTSGD
ncbi:MAG TPA: MFS transporter [Segeticoccus sp.]|uniref:MFS transporter n=1 Tax=Segeticoccus sp. TaxID=2706531 RepID=UPI002D80F0DF|nr:MFS transporter [Segeticoccus sp.]HET8600051.1 MFS transporter [Segeticoccus sp.]